MRRRALGWVLLAPQALLSACGDCDRAGCDALTQLASPGSSGVAGVIAQASDLVRDGCSECPLASASVELWELEAPFERRAEVAELVAARPPDLKREVSGHYREALDTGWYLLCVRPSCVELNVHEGETLTVNVQRRDGPTSFFVGRPGAAPLAEDVGVDVGF